MPLSPQLELASVERENRKTIRTIFEESLRPPRVVDAFTISIILHVDDVGTPYNSDVQLVLAPIKRTIQKLPLHLFQDSLQPTRADLGHTGLFCDGYSYFFICCGDNYSSCVSGLQYFITVQKKRSVTIDIVLVEEDTREQRVCCCRGSFQRM